MPSRTTGFLSASTKNSENAQILNSDDIFYDEDMVDDELGFRYDRFPKNRKTVSCQKRSLCCYSFIGLVFALVIGFVVGRYSVILPEEKSAPTSSITWSYNGTIRDVVLKEIKAENIKRNLELLTKKPHLAGSDQNEQYLVNIIKERWMNQLDDVKLFPYTVLLSYPNSTDKSYVGIKYTNGTVTDKSHADEPPATESEKIGSVVSAINAYSPSGHVEGPLFYVNYGREEDFLKFTEMQLNLSGAVCIARYGRLFRGDKVKFAERFNCSALILYTDPIDYAGAAVHSITPNDSDYGYPNSWWMPSTGFQRGSLQTDGDPLTPNYPSLNFTYRIPRNKAALPTIPVLPISYKDAYKYLSMLNGVEAPDEWQGGLDVVYRLGGSFVKSHTSCRVIVHVSNFEVQKTVYTITGYIHGWLEPDRYVLFGNHRDAWTYGGADPSSGTAILLEVSRAIGMLVESKQWRPRRTIVFCNWGAEEYGLIGSTEWVEQMEKRLLLQAVAYVNIDIAVEGNRTFRAKASPSLKQLLFNSSMAVSNPSYGEIVKGRKTVFDTWLNEDADLNNPKRPFVRILGSGSDFTSFLQKTGVASLDIRYTFGHNVHASSYPVYHSIHDTFDYFQNFLDPQFNFSLAVAGVAADNVLQLSGSIILPLNPIDTATELSLMSGMLQNKYRKIFNGSSLSLTKLNESIGVFSVAAHNIMKHIKALNASAGDLELRRINDKLFYINRGFLDFAGIPDRRQYRNVVFAPSSRDSYSGAGFPSVYDACIEYERGKPLGNVEQALSVLSIEILSAAQLLNDF